jgi:SAM-dependent methyltransferase
MNPMADIETGRSLCASIARRRIGSGGLTEQGQRCVACQSRLHRMPEDSKPQGRQCRSCGLIVQDPGRWLADREKMVQHYSSVDPHEKIAVSKADFYYRALQYLDPRVAHYPRRLLDVGCGFGYFLEQAAAFRWETLGVEIVPAAVLSAKRRLPGADVFCGTLRDATLPEASLDAVTLWDVLSHVEDPAVELAECHRILAAGGIIGIRVRNVTNQLWLCRFFYRVAWLWQRLGIKPLHVFHRYNFTCKALEKLLLRQGFVNIVIQNSPSTTGDPYQYFSIGAVVGFGKILTHALSGWVYRLTHGQWVIGPSLLVWAQKP